MIFVDTNNNNNISPVAEGDRIISYMIHFSDLYSALLSFSPSSLSLAVFVIFLLESMTEEEALLG